MSNIQDSYKAKLMYHCDPHKILESTLFPEKYSIDQGACWLCWMRLTGKDLLNWRKEPYYATKLQHEKECPVCGYKHWLGATWYPFRYLQRKKTAFSNNPSFRRGA